MASKFRDITCNLGDSIIPKKNRNNAVEYLRSAGVEQVPYFAYGIALYTFIILAILFDFLLLFTVLSNLGLVLKIIIGLIGLPILYFLILKLTIFTYRLILDIKIAMKIKDMENRFPEFLAILSINLRSGSNLASALENSADKDLGALAEEIKLVVKRVKLGSEVKEALDEFKAKYKSDLMNDTFDLILLSWKKGGNVAVLVDKIYDNIKSSNYLEQKVIAGVANYKIFLTILVLGITPAMFALAYHLIDLVRRITSELADIPKTSAMPFTINAVRFNDSHFFIFSVISVIMISIFISLVINIVKSGDIKGSYKHIFFYAISSYISYQFFMWVFAIFFSMFAV